MGSVVRTERGAGTVDVAQVVPDVVKVDAEHEALCREAIVVARQLAVDDDDRELPPVLPASDKLTQVAQKSGWPPRFRGLLWAMAGNHLRRVSEANGISYRQLVSHRRPVNSSTCMTEIERDLGRTLPGQRGPNGEEDFFATEVGRNQLKNVLAAYAAHNPTVGYCQSMNFLAAVLLLQIKDEESSFWSLALLVDEVLPHYYHRSLSGLSVDQAVLEEYAQEQIPQVLNKLRSLSFDMALFTTNWLLCFMTGSKTTGVFINSLPWDCVLRILDILLVERDAQVLLRAAAAILKLMQPQIMLCQNQEDLFNLLKSKGPLTLEKGRKIEPGLLAKTVYVDLGPLTNLSQRRAKHATLLRAKQRDTSRAELPFQGNVAYCGI